MNPVELIAAKRDGREHSRAEIDAIIAAICTGEMADYQASAWLMAVYLRGMTPAETLNLTLAMRDSGETVHWPDYATIRLDKHSTGGVGDKTTLSVAPILAAAGIPILKMSGRGLGFSGGTIDKLESIPGFKTNLSIQDAMKQVEEIGIAIIGQSPTMVPADKILYSLRDVTATVDCIPLIAASIMSKKLAGGANAVILDVKVGRGSFMKSRERAAELARTMVEIGTNAGVRTKAILTDMDSPLGIAVGNAVEVREAIEVLAGKWQGSRLRDLCVQLSARAIHLSGKATSLKDGLNVANEMIDSGAALAKLGELIKAQGGEEGVCQNPNLLPVSRATYEVKSTSSGFVKSIDAEKIGRIAVDMGAGRLRKSDTIDPTVGIVFYVGVGDKVSGRDILAEFEHNNSPRCSEFERAIIAAFEFSDTSVEVRPIIFEEIG